MFRNYLLIALRNFRKNKSYIFINSFGLGIALACSISAYIILAFNIEFDDHFKNQPVDQIYRVHTSFEQPDGSTGEHLVTPMIMGPTMAQDIAGISRFTRYNAAGGFVRAGENSFNEGIQFADSTFFEMFGFEVIKGDINSFKKLNTVIISEENALKYFPDTNPVGEILTMHFANEKKLQFVIGAVIKRPPTNSSFYFNNVVRAEHFAGIYDLSETDWGDWRDGALLVELTNPDIAASIPELTKEYVKIRNEKKPEAKVKGFHLESFLEPVNQDDIAWSMMNLRISIVPLIVFSLMALMILLIACFNLTNTSFAITVKRLKEVGVRKVVGATRGQIVRQFLFEMLLTIVLSLLVGLAVAKVIANEFTEMWNLGYGLSDLNGLNLVIALLILVISTSLLAGLYPALANSRFMPAQLLKSNIKLKGANWFTKTLVTLQFAISVFVLINGIVFIQNSKFQEQVNYGFDLNVLMIPIGSFSDYTILNNQIKTYPKITHSAVTHHQLGWSSYPFPIAIDTSEYQVRNIEVGRNFFETMGLKLIEGQFLNMDLTTDQKDAVVVNEAFVKHTNLKNPVGQKISIRGEKKRIVGVIENHLDNLFRSKEPEPFVFYGSKPNEYKMMLVKGDKNDMAGINDYMETIWKKNFPERPYDASFQEDQMLRGLRQTNNNLKRIFLFLTVLGGLLSMSGIYALASLNVEKRTKEIGVRKVLGASVPKIIGLLSKEFLIILMIAAILGSTGGYLLSTMLLDEIYAVHITVGAFPILFGSLIIFLMGSLTTSWIIGKAALTNPVLSLRDE